MQPDIPRAKHFFRLARERYRIKLKKDAGQPWPWTDDTILQTWRFTNIFREDDRTTRWLRENVRDPLNDQITGRDDDANRRKLVESVMIFRWFNRIETGQIIRDLLLGTWDSREAHRRLRLETTVFTGAYIVIGHPNMPKLEGVLRAIDNAIPKLPYLVPSWQNSLEGAWKDIKTIDYLGGFMAHEIVQDLRYTKILENAQDINTWGNLGPGAIRGISWLMYGHDQGFNDSAEQQRIMLGLMAQLLEMSRDPENWPAEWPAWEMHQVEFLLCEVAKYFRAYHGFRQKRKYTPGRV